MTGHAFSPSFRPIPLVAFDEMVGLGGIEFGVGAAGPFEEGFQAFPVMAGGLEAYDGDFGVGYPVRRFQEGFHALLGVLEGEEAPRRLIRIVGEAFVPGFAGVGAHVNLLRHSKISLSNRRAPDHVWNGRSVKIQRTGNVAWLVYTPKPERDSPIWGTGKFYPGL